MEGIKCLISTKEFQEKILDLIGSEKLDEFIENTTFKDTDKAAIIYGLTLATLHTCQCQLYFIRNESDTTDKS